jgi:hypothetical protein
MGAYSGIIPDRAKLGGMRDLLSEYAELSEMKADPYQLGALQRGMKIDDGRYTITKVSKSMKQVTIWSPPPKNFGGYKASKRSFVFRWDGTGYKRQGQYLRPSGTA